MNNYDLGYEALALGWRRKCLCLPVCKSWKETKDYLQEAKPGWRKQFPEEFDKVLAFVRHPDNTKLPREIIRADCVHNLRVGGRLGGIQQNAHHPQRIQRMHTPINFSCPTQVQMEYIKGKCLNCTWDLDAWAGCRISDFRAAFRVVDHKLQARIFFPGPQPLCLLACRQR